MVNNTDCFCVDILVEKIGVHHAKVALWDVVLLIPATLFLIYLSVTMAHAVRRLKTEPRAIFRTFYVLVWVATVFSVVRCVVALAASDTVEVVKILWVLLHLILFITAMMVVSLGLAFGSSSGNKIIIRAFIVSVPISVVWAVTQTVLEFTVKPVIEHAKVIGDNGTHTGGSGNDAYFLYGGVKFMLAESSFFVVVYFIPFLLLLTSHLHQFKLPARKSFYLYCLLLGMCHVGQCVGLSLILVYQLDDQSVCSDSNFAYCIMDTTSFLYYTLLVPTIYVVFLHSYFRKAVKFQKDIDDKLYKDGTSMTENSPLVHGQTDSMLVNNRKFRSQSVAEKCFGAVGNSCSLNNPDDILGSLNSLSPRPVESQCDTKLVSSLADLD